MGQGCVSEGGSEINRLASAIERLSIAVEQSTQASSNPQAHDWEFIPSGSSGSAPAVLSWEQRVDRIEFNNYDAFAEELPPVPAHLLRLCERLRSGPYSCDFRAKRAWEAGFWAYLTIKGKVRAPRATERCDLPKSVYILLRAPGLEKPARFSRFSDLRRAAGRLEDNPEVVCHGFASLAEAETYCEAAGYRLP